MLLILAIHRPIKIGRFLAYFISKNNSISMTELDDYDKIANKIQASAKHIADQIEQQIVIPVTDKMIEYTMQNSDQNLIDFLPHDLHKEYSNRLLKNAVEE